MRRSEQQTSFLDRLARMLGFRRAPAKPAETKGQFLASLPQVDDDLKDVSRRGPLEGMQVVEIERTAFVLEWERVVASVEAAQGKDAPGKRVDRRLPQYDRRLGQGDRRTGERRKEKGIPPPQASSHRTKN